MAEKIKVKQSIKTKQPEPVEKAVPVPKVPAIVKFEVMLNQFMQEHQQELQMFELIGFMELKLIEFKEGWRIRMQQNMQAQMQAQIEAANESQENSRGNH